MAQKKQQNYIKKENQHGKFLQKGDASAAERRKTIGKNLSFGSSEAYKLLRTNLMLSMADEGSCKIIGITSALRGEGKSTTAANLAYSLAQSGKQTLLLEADMRIPIQASVFRIEEKPGLSHVLTGMSSLTEAIRQQTPIHTMSILPAGEIPPNPSELLSSKHMKAVLDALAKVFEYIIIDLPPITAVSDGLAVSKLLSGMIVVVREDYCDRYSLAETMQRLEMLEVKLLGFVFNGAEPAKKRYGKYGYKYSQDSKYGYRYGSHDSAKGTGAAAPSQNAEGTQGRNDNV